MSTMDELHPNPPVLREVAPQAETDPVIMRYVGGGYLTVGGLPARDLRASDFVATHWTPETAAAIEGGKVYEMVGTVAYVQEDGMPVWNAANKLSANAAKD